MSNIDERSVNNLKGGAETSTNPFEEELEHDNPFFESDNEKKSSADSELPVSISVPNLNPFHGIISKCFEPYLHIYIDSQDQSLVELLDRAGQEQRKKGHVNLAVEGSSVLHR